MREGLTAVTTAGRSAARQCARHVAAGDGTPSGDGFAVYMPQTFSPDGFGGFGLPCQALHPLFRREAGGHLPLRAVPAPSPRIGSGEVWGPRLAAARLAAVGRVAGCLGRPCCADCPA